MISSSSPVNISHDKSLEVFLKQVRFSEYNEDDQILREEKMFYDILWAKKAMGYPEPEMGHFQCCCEWKFIVWDTAGEHKDNRCYKCAHLYPFDTNEPPKSRNKTPFPPGQCAESLTVRRILDLGQENSSNDLLGDKGCTSVE
jgi:hypothetical protein